MSIEGMMPREFDKWRQAIIDYLSINPPNRSMVYSISSSKSECFGDDEKLSRVFQIMIDSGELEYIKEMGAFRLSVSTARE